ncbi:MAG: peptidoglycan DD-metalloendopeptidase family protein [Immundisolibacteraceae bacterium]|nr:peptidoglycan DD-metalloendopeptidase family protein [Immundisolibacteraceae bacterium]
MVLFGSNDSSQPNSEPSARYRQQLLGSEMQLSPLPLPFAGSTTTESTPQQKTSPSIEPSDTIETAPIKWRSERIKAGDSFAIAMQRLGHSASMVANIMLTGPAAQQLTHIKPGHLLELYETKTGLEQIRYEIDPLTRLEIILNTTPPKAAVVDLPVETRFRHASADIDSSLYLAGLKADLSDALIMELANIFGWDVDFTLDLRKGDRFTVVYSELYLNAEKVSDGQIYAAELITRRRQIRATRYEDKSGAISYYTPEGKSMRKAFSQNPLPITRVTSRFNPNRLHPIFKTRRPHRGVDYGAASGTPVRTTGDGKVIFKGKKNGYGNTVIIQHGQRYTTLYAHLKSFSRKLRQGSSVKQGQTIAYVGQTGWATGPHLHYEFRVNGVHKNPLTVKLPPATPVKPNEKHRFLAQVKPYIEQLDTLSSHQLASN